MTLKLYLSALFAFWLALTQSSTPPKVSDPNYLQLRSLKISGEPAPASGLTLRRDAATFVFKSGEFYFTEPVQGKVVSAVFIGDGEFRMEPPTAVEKHNLEIFVKFSA